MRAVGGSVAFRVYDGADETWVEVGSGGALVFVPQTSRGRGGVGCVAERAGP